MKQRRDRATVRDRLNAWLLKRAFYTIDRAIARGRGDEVAPLLATVIEQYLPGDIAARVFPLWERHGFHLTRNHFYSPIPDLGALPERLWTEESQLPGVAINEREQLALLRNVFPRFAAEYSTLPLEPTADPREFYLHNSQFGWIDALALYCLIRHYQPRTIVEVGSGFSTRLSARALAANGSGQLIAIEPYPDAHLAALPGVTTLLATPVQEVELAVFTALTANDIVFIDSTHVARTGGDVPFLYLEVLPRLQPGVLVHIHDIFLPSEYPRAWLTDHHLFWNEQYLLHAFLLFNDAFEVLFASNFLGLRHPAEVRRTFPTSPTTTGGSFWLRRKPQPASEEASKNA